MLEHRLELWRVRCEGVFVAAVPFDALPHLHSLHQAMLSTQQSTSRRRRSCLVVVAPVPILVEGVLRWILIGEPG